MIKRFFTVLLCNSLLIFNLVSCKQNAPRTPEASRFEQLLKEAHLNNRDTVQYIVWNDMSCGGCRSYTAQLLQKGTGNKQVKMIVPLSYVNDLQQVNRDQVIIDSTGLFSKLYYGVDNIGIVNVCDNEVISIKNYNADAMDSLKKDLLR